MCRFDLLSSTLFANLTELEYFNPEGIWWPPSISSKPLRFLRVQCLVDDAHFDLPKLLKCLPATLQDLLIGISIGIGSNVQQGGVRFDGNFVDASIAASNLPNLRALHLDIWDPKNAQVVKFPNTTSWCARKGVEFTSGRYTLQREPYMFSPWHWHWQSR